MRGRAHAPGVRAGSRARGRYLRWQPQATE